MRIFFLYFHSISSFIIIVSMQSEENKSANYLNIKISYRIAFASWEPYLHVKTISKSNFSFSLLNDVTYGLSRLIRFERVNNLRIVCVCAMQYRIKMKPKRKIYVFGDGWVEIKRNLFVVKAKKNSENVASCLLRNLILCNNYNIQNMNTTHVGVIFSLFFFFFAKQFRFLVRFLCFLF